jgi:hypothetical protein
MCKMTPSRCCSTSATQTTLAGSTNLTDKKYPGNPTKSFRSRNPLRITGEVTDWQGHSAEELKAMKENLERLRQLGVEAIED